MGKPRTARKKTSGKRKSYTKKSNSRMPEGLARGTKVAPHTGSTGPEETPGYRQIQPRKKPTQSIGTKATVGKSSPRTSLTYGRIIRHPSYQATPSNAPS